MMYEFKICLEKYTDWAKVTRKVGVTSIGLSGCQNCVTLKIG